MSKYAGNSSVKLNRPMRSDFDLSHYQRSTTRMGRLTPVFITEAVPSDTFHGSSEILLRLAPLLAPIYDNIILFVHYFFVPNRLLWSDWEEFITGGRLGVGIDPVTAPIPPYFEPEAILNDNPEVTGKSQLLDYLGVPPYMWSASGAVPADWAGIKLDAMPILAFQKVWMDYYRDRNFVVDDYMEFPVPSGNMTVNYPTADYTQYLQNRTRAFEHDYFTSALPFVQRGVEVLLPLLGTGSVSYLDESLMFESDGVTPMVGGALSAIGLVGGNSGIGTPGSGAGQVQNIDAIQLTQSDTSINDFRSAYALQVWAERNAVGGSRYNESTHAHFGVKPQDSRLQRAEYIGGGRIPVRISEIVSTAYSQDSGDFTVPLANLAGHGITYGNTNQFNYFCSEHGFIIGIASIMNPRSYHQGLSKMWRRRSFLDYIWPTFAKLGEQQVDKAEIFADHITLTEDPITGQLPLFGYQSRYADWKQLLHQNHGDFHDTLLFWTLTSHFTTVPVLGRTFVEFDDSTPDRIFAVQGGVDSIDNFWMYVNNQIRVKRPLPYFGTPNTLGFS